MTASAQLPPGRAAVLAILLLAGLGCGEKPAVKATRTIRLATTTSTDNSGLLGVLLPPFTKKYGIGVHVIAVGTGKAIQYGKNGDVDVVLVHAPSMERKFVNEGYGVNRRVVMHNDFVILGPLSDPAGVHNAEGAAEGLAKIAKSGSTFVSRGDESGTHVKERELWSAAGLEPAGTWYMAVGQGMGTVLVMADQKQAYTLSDRATYVAFRDKVSLVVLVEGDETLFNPYSVIAVNPAKHRHVKYVDAMTFIGWLTSPEGQQTIGGYKMAGDSLFHPAAVRY